MYCSTLKVLIFISVSVRCWRSFQLIRSPDVDFWSAGSRDTCQVNKPDEGRFRVTGKARRMILFDCKLIPQEVFSLLPKDYTLRPLERSDRENGILEVLAELTTVGHVNQTRFEQYFDYIKSLNDAYYTVVIANGNARIVACGTVFVERKLIHACSLVGHIEDVAVAKSEQGKRLGQRIIQVLDGIAEAVGCYKNTLACAEKNQVFYEKCKGIPVIF